MASRYPLVINNSTSLVGELPIGDSLNLTGSGIFDGISTGSNGQVLSSNNGTLRWVNAANVFLDDVQTLQNKTLTNSVIDASLNTITNIANANLLSSSIEINGTTVPLGGSITIPDTNDNTIYGISVADGVNASQKRIRLTAGGSGSGVQDIFFNISGNYLSITRSNNDTLTFSVSLQNLTSGSYIVYDNSATTYNGVNARTIAVDATTGSSNNKGQSKVVARDSNGDFWANMINANVTGNLTGTASNVSNSLKRGSYLTGSDYNGSSETTWAVDAAVGTSSARGGNKIVARDSNGDFWARNINGSTIRATVSVTVDRGTNPHGFLRSDGSVDTSDYITLEEVPPQFPSGTQMIFRQASAPTDWTKQTDTTLNNAALRCVTGSSTGTGGSNNFSTAFNSDINDGATLTVGNLSGTVRYTGAHTISADQVPPHAHLPNRASGDGARSSFFCRGYGNGESPLNSGGGGSYAENFGSDQSDTRYGNGSGNNSHSHSISSSFSRGSFNLNVKYVDIIIARKD